MKRIVLLISICLLTFNGIAQKKVACSEDDLKQFYRTILGQYKGQLGDSTHMTIRFVPANENKGQPFRWLYMEAINDATKEVVTENILEIEPISDITFNVIVYDIRMRGKKSFVFLKTKDFEYQTGWNSRKSLKCFPSGDKIHFKFVQEDERLYIKRIPKHSSNIIGMTFFKEPTD
jgi:hypothetical protein